MNTVGDDPIADQLRRWLRRSYWKLRGQRKTVWHRYSFSVTTRCTVQPLVPLGTWSTRSGMFGFPAQATHSQRRETILRMVAQSVRESAESEGWIAPNLPTGVNDMFIIHYSCQRDES